MSSSKTGNKGFWRTRDFGEQGILANKGFWRTRDFGEQGILGNKGFWRTGNFDCRDTVKRQGRAHQPANGSALRHCINIRCKR